MSLTYKTRHGIDWPSNMPDVLIDLTIGKKWRLLEQELGIKIKDPWVPMLDAAKALIPRDLFKVSEWTEQHFHDFVSYDKLITWGCASSSKAQPLTSTVYTPDGPRMMRDIEVGDYVLGRDGKATRVKAIHKVGYKKVYRLTFYDDTSVECADDHLWTVRECCDAPWGEEVGNTFKPFTDKASTLKDMVDMGMHLAIPMCDPVWFTARSVPVDPYLAGFLLGGAVKMRDGTVALVTVDKTQIKEVKRHMRKRGSIKENCSHVYEVHGEEVEALKAEGLWGSKKRFIPDCYKYNTVDIRKAFVAGLIDSHGVIDTGSPVLNFNTQQMAEDAAEMVRSLGGRAYIVDYMPTHLCGSKAVKFPRVYTVMVYLPGVKDLLRCKKKAAKCTAKNDVKEKRIKKIERTGRYADMKCITVENEDGLYLTEAFNCTHNSNDTALLLVLDWVVDPYDTVTLLGSTTKEDLKSRSWEGVERYHHALRNNKLGFLVPGKISKQGQKLINHDEDDVAGSSGEKAGIQGRAINEGGRLQGAHAKYVRLVVDELAEISNHEAIKTAIANLRVGTTSFKFIGLANPESWDNPSCQYCEPPQGRDKVDVDTGSWFSTFGCFVRHHDGLKSPCVKNPELRSEFPFLMSMDEYESVLREAGGNPDAPQIWKMIRGFPVPLGTMIPTVLDPKIAAENHVGELIPDANMYPVAGVAAGIDPAWSEGGDGAYHSKVVVRIINGKPILDFGGGLSRLTISATDSRPVTKQLRDQVISIMRTPGNAPLLRHTAIDSSGNQGLADDLDITLSDACLHVNSSQRASDYSLRATDNRKAKEIVYDRGTESWAVLAEFCRAGMVRGLPQEALTQLTQRRYACRNGTTAQLFPLRMEAKDKFRLRFKKSPDEADACALAALAVKERLGILPFSFILPKNATVNEGLFLGQLSQPDNLQELPDSGEYINDFDYGAYEPI